MTPDDGDRERARRAVRRGLTWLAACMIYGMGVLAGLVMGSLNAPWWVTPLAYLPVVIGLAASARESRSGW